MPQLLPPPPRPESSCRYLLSSGTRACQCGPATATLSSAVIDRHPRRCFTSPMDTTNFRAKLREIIDSLDHPQAVAFEYAFSTGSKPLQEALARTALLVGEAPIELVDGIVKDDDDEDDVEGWLVVATADRLIRAAFGRADDGQ